MFKNKIVLPVLGAMLVAGIGTFALTYAHSTDAQTTTTTNVSGSTTSNSSQSDHKMRHGMGHAPLGNDGNITAINGTIITMQEEADEGGGIYTVDASSASFNKNRNSAQITDFQVGDKIFVQGTISGNNVKASEVSTGHFGRGYGHRNDKKQPTPTNSSTQ